MQFISQFLHWFGCLESSFCQDLQKNNNRDWFANEKETYLKAAEFVDQLVPDMASKLEHYPGGRPICDL